MRIVATFQGASRDDRRRSVDRQGRQWREHQGKCADPRQFAAEEADEDQAGEHDREGGNRAPRRGSSSGRPRDQPDRPHRRREAAGENAQIDRAREAREPARPRSTSAARPSASTGPADRPARPSTDQNVGIPRPRPTNHRSSEPGLPSTPRTRPRRSQSVRPVRRRRFSHRAHDGAGRTPSSRPSSIASRASQGSQSSTSQREEGERTALGPPRPKAASASRQSRAR